MKDNKTVTINGISYDASTGLPTKKQGSNNPPKKIRHSMDIARSKHISHFIPQQKPKAKKPKNPKPQMDIKPVKHPLVKKVESMQQQIKGLSKKPIIEKAARQIKEEVIAKSLNNTTENKREERKIFNKRFKYINVFGISIAAILLIGFLIYLYMPSFSVHIASAQAGIRASYPQYQPDGYSLKGPIAYSEGEVSMTFHANTGESEFTLKQSKSSWDSSAVKEKVNKDSKGKYIVTPTETNGLNIYTYNGNATWVNGGILYTINGDAKLSNDQIRRIAASL